MCTYQILQLIEEKRAESFNIIDKVSLVIN